MQVNEKYVSLRALSEMLGENYSTIRDYKREFNIYLEARLFGRRVKYSKQNADLFRYILDLKEDGYSNEEVEKMLILKKETDGRMDGRMDERMDEQADGRMDGDMNKIFYSSPGLFPMVQGSHLLRSPD